MVMGDAVCLMVWTPLLILTTCLKKKKKKNETKNQTGWKEKTDLELQKSGK